MHLPVNAMTQPANHAAAAKCVESAVQQNLTVVGGRNILELCCVGLMKDT